MVTPTIIKTHALHKAVKVALLELPTGARVPVYFDAARAQFTARVLKKLYHGDTLTDLTAEVWEHREALNPQHLVWYPVLEVQMTLPSVVETADRHSYYLSNNFSILRYRHAAHTFLNGNTVFYRQPLGKNASTMLSVIEDRVAVTYARNDTGGLLLPQLVVRHNPVALNHRAETGIVLLLPYDDVLWTALLGALYGVLHQQEVLYNLLRHPQAAALLRSQQPWIMDGQRLIAGIAGQEDSPDG